MAEEKKASLERLLDESIAFRTLERTLQLQLEERAANLGQWVELTNLGPDENLPPIEYAEIVELVRQQVAILKEIHALRGNATGADEDPPLFIGGTVIPIPVVEVAPAAPLEAARDVLLGAHDVLDGSLAGEDVVGAFEAYHRELWASLARKGML